MVSQPADVKIPMFAGTFGTTAAGGSRSPSRAGGSPNQSPRAAAHAARGGRASANLTGTHSTSPEKTFPKPGDGQPGAFRRRYGAGALYEVKEEEEPQVLKRLTRAEKYRRAITPGEDSFGVRSRGRKGGRIAAQPLSAKILKPLANSFSTWSGELEADWNPYRTHTQHDLRNRWFKANQLPSLRTTLPSRCATTSPTRSARRSNRNSTATSQRSPTRMDRTSNNLSSTASVGMSSVVGTPTKLPADEPVPHLVHKPSFGEDGLLVKRMDAEVEQRTNNVEMEFSNLVQSTRNKYKMGKYVADAEIIWDYYREGFVEEEAERVGKVVNTLGKLMRTSDQEDSAVFNRKSSLHRRLQCEGDDLTQPTLDERQSQRLKVEHGHTRDGRPPLRVPRMSLDSGGALSLKSLPT